MVSARVYDWMNRVWAPWDSVGVRQDLVDLLERAKCPRAATLAPSMWAVGQGANVVHLAGAGFDSWGWTFRDPPSARRALLLPQPASVPLRRG